jgi:hypothetical protein
MDRFSPWLIDDFDGEILFSEEGTSEIGGAWFGEIPFDRPQSCDGNLSSTCFTLRTLFGHKVDQEDRLTEIRAALTEVLAKGTSPKSPPAKPGSPGRRSDSCGETSRAAPSLFVPVSGVR